MVSKASYITPYRRRFALMKRVIRKLTLLIALMFFCASAFSQSITFSGRNVSLKKAFSAIKTQTGFVVMYNTQQLDKARPITISVVAEPLDGFLKKIFEGQPLDYSIEKTTIFVSSKAAGPRRDTTAPGGGVAGGASGMVHGKVFIDGVLAVGITVTERNSANGTKTDDNGEFRLYNVRPMAILVFTSVYSEPAYINVQGRTEIPVMLVQRVTDLGDVTVNKGYYTEQEKVSTGDVTTIKDKDIARINTTDPMLALEARVPGLFIAPSSGLPGAPVTVQLRGQNSFSNGTDPLYIIDGVPFSPDNYSVFRYAGISAAFGGISPLSTINPQDILEISVLKDADATAIYGSRGANGVILITTKKGRAGKTIVDFDVSTSAGKMPLHAHMLNTQQYLMMRNEAFANDGATPSQFSDYDVNGQWDTTRYTDWQRKLLGGTATTTNVQGRVSGGDETTQFSINGGYRRETLIYSTSNQADKQANFNSNITHHSVNRKFSLSLNAGYTSDVNTLPTVDLTATALNLSPDAPALYKPGTDSLNWQNNTFNNPLAILRQQMTTTTNNLTGNLTLGYDVLKGLNLRVNTGYNLVIQNEVQLQPGTSINPDYLAQGSGLRTSYQGRNQTKSWIAEPQVNYSYQKGKNRLQMLVGASFQEVVRNASGVEALGFSSDNQLLNLALAQYYYYQPDQYSDYKYSALYGRLNYNWDNKYIINFTGRRDGSSRFGPGKQFGNFGAVGAAWIFSEESWARRFPWLSLGKLRASYGVTGNDQIGDYKFLNTYSYQYFPYGGVIGLQPTQLYNPDLAWEVNKKMEVGVNLGFLKDRVNISASYFRNRSGNQLISYILPDITGFSSVTANLPAVVQNTGVEFTVNTTNISSKHFYWRTGLMLTIPRNKLVSFPGLASTPYASYVEVGKSLYARQQYRYVGVDPQKGVMTYDDINKDGQINQLDFVHDKEVSQRLFGGVENTLSWRGIELNVFIEFVKQNGRSFQSNFGMPGTMSNQPVGVLARWRQAGDNTDVQQFSQQSFGGSAAMAYSEFRSYGNNAIVDASFIRLRNAGLSYTLGKKVSDRLHLQKLQAYLSGNNLFTLTKYVGLDPSTQGQTLPPLRVITIGLRVSL